MGEYNSSVTRVWPVFDSLFHSDTTGTAWLTAVSLGKVTEMTQTVAPPASMFKDLRCQSALTAHSGAKGLFWRLSNWGIRAPSFRR
jgi:hypothetical protein